MLSKKSKYGLIAMLYLAREFEKGQVLIADLAQKENIPKKFLEAILLELKNRGLLQSKKGKGGGYWLAKNPKEVYIGQIIRLLDGPLAPVSCASQTAYHKCAECRDEHNCGIRLVMKDVRDAMSNILDKTSLADALDRVSHQKHNKMFNYQI